MLPTGEEMVGSSICSELTPALCPTLLSWPWLAFAAARSPTVMGSILFAPSCATIVTCGAGVLGRARLGRLEW